MVINQDEDVESLSINKDKQKSDVFGLWVKLKIPKEEEEEEVGIHIADHQEIGYENKDNQMMKKYSNDMKRVCQICHKAFSSGKALGGHMRIHVQLSNKKDPILKKKLKFHHTISEEKELSFVEKKQNSCNMMKKAANCIICGKDFPSMKSLFGHMRCHPERDWRGIHPPPPKNSSSSSSSLSDAEPPKIDEKIGVLYSGERNRAVVDLTESLMSWPVTAKRGRKAAGSSSELSVEDDRLRDAVNYLMMLAHGDSGLTERRNLGESEAANGFCKGKNVEINRLSKPKRRLNIYFSDDDGDDDAQMDGKIRADKLNYRVDFESVVNSEKAVMIKNGKKKRKKVKLCDLKLSKSVVDDKVVEATVPHDKYKCNTCDKSFPNHQALGGHRSSHNKFNTFKDDGKKGVVLFNNVSTSLSQKQSNDSGVVEAPSSSQLAPSSTETGSQICGRVLDFDLNVAPPSEDEAGFESELACSSCF